VTSPLATPVRKQLALIIIVNVVIFLAPFTPAQTVTLAGKVTDGDTGEAVRHAIVTIVETGWRTETDERGRFKVDNLVAGRYTLSVRHLTYATSERMCAVGSTGADTVQFRMQTAVLQSGEVVVQSTRMSESLDNTPYPLEVRSHDDISQNPAVTIADALASVPGLALVRDGPWETSIAIRGQSRSNIVTILDGVRIETANDIGGALSLINMHDLERVEVMKSAASTQHGSGALGGVVLMTSSRPEFTDQFHLGGVLTNDFTSVDRGASQYLALEGSASRVAFRVSGGHRRAGNTMTPEGVLPNSQYRDFSLCGNLSIATIGGQSALLTYQRAQAEDTGIPGGAPFAAPATATYTLARRELFGVEYRMPNLFMAVPLLTFRASRQQISRNVEVIQSPVLTVTPHAVHTTTSAQVEARLCPVPDVLVSVGGEVWERELDSRRERRNASTNQIVGERPVPVSHYTSAGVFVYNEWEALPGWLTATCGARYDWIRVGNDEAWTPEYVISSGALQTNPVGQRLLWGPRIATDASWSANAGVRCAASPVLDVSLLYSTAFRSPSLEERYEFIDLGSVVNVGNPDLRSERSSCLDAGIRLHGDASRVRVDGFVDLLENLVSQEAGVYEGRKAYYRANIGKARIYGCEVEVNHSISSWCALHASMAYVRGEETANHTNLSQIPPFNGELGVRAHLSGLGTIVLTSLWCLAQENLAVDELRTPGHAILNFGVSGEPWIIGGTSVTFRSELHNCFDKAFRNHLSTLRGIIKNEPGRNLMLSATVTM
jgi:outer membrane receptor protein involved in Fe transport